MALFCARNGSLQTIKGVFECKNMLREGVDYEVYDWLVGDGAAYINTKFLAADYAAINLKLKIKDIGRYDAVKYILAAGEVNNFLGFNISTRNNNTYVRITDGKNHVRLLGSAIGEHTFELRQGNVYYDNVYYTNSFISYPYNGRLLYLFNSPLGGSVATGSVGELIIDEKMSLTPCQLLKNIPSTLDANGKARVAGECGMYDAVSGKFFGNVASRGSFTVTND